MNSKKVNGSKNALPRKENYECDSNSTESFDMNDFKVTSLNKRYSVPVHKNNADLMAELDRINIMGDESDVELIEVKSEQNSLVVNVSNVNSPNTKVVNLYTSQPNDALSNGDLDHVKEERILAWAQSQSQNLPISVASILSDHDYLSQERLIGIVTGNEERNEADNSINHVLNGNDVSETDQPNEDSNLTIIENGNVTSSNEFEQNNIVQFNVILKKLTDSKTASERLDLLSQIEKKAKQLREQQKDGNQGEETQNSSSITSGLSPNLSEPLEYYGDRKFSTQTSLEETQDDDGNDVVLAFRNELKKIDDITNRISITTQSMDQKLTHFRTLPESERLERVEKMRKSASLLMTDMAKELTNSAENIKTKSAEGETSNQKVHDKKKIQLSDSTDDNYNDTSRKSRKLKRRRVTRSHADSLHSSSNSESCEKNSCKNEPFVISQDIDDLMNGNGSNSTNESIEKENDLFGFDNSGDVEIGIKTELMLNSESTNRTSSIGINASQNAMDVSLNSEKNDVSNDVTKNHNKDESMQSAIEESNSSGASIEDANLDPDDDDEDIRKLLDFTAIANRRNASAAKVNGIVNPKKFAKKPKEDEVAKLLANSDDTDKPVESDDEQFEPEEFTEDQYLEEQNQSLKKQMLEDTSESEIDSNDSDGEENVNGDGRHYDSDSESKTSNSDESLMEQFLASESRSDGRKSPSEKQPEKLNESNASVAETPAPKSKEESPKKNATEKSDDANDEIDSDIEFDIGCGNFTDSPRKTKSTIGKNVFSNIEKDHHILVPSEDEDGDSKTQTNDKEKAESDSSGKNSNVLDTSMFKPLKKDFNPQQLSKVLQSTRNKQAASRLSPEECISVSSDDDYEIESTSAEKKDGNEDDEEEKEKRVTRKLLRHDQLADDTKVAQREESDRIKRLEKKNERLSQYFETQRLSQESEGPVDAPEVLLDLDTKKDEKIVVHPEITKHLKQHQVEGIKFMYDCCYGSVDNIEKFPGSGCILAHCMGLGKTLQLITLLHTVISYPQLKTDKVLVICPKSTVMNWKEEIERWLSPIKNTRRLKLFHFPEQSDVNSKLQTLKEWSQCGKEKNKQAGCLLLGYEAFRVLVFYHNSKKSQSMYSSEELERLRKSIHKHLLDPGADLVVCDEGHMIKNQKSTTSCAVNKISTKRRIVLTGAPIQNNLKEYCSMVNFIKPSFLGTEKEFANLYVNPIKNGQHKDSSKNEIKHMKQRSYVLHKKLSRFVQRREAALLKQFLPDKFEFVLFIPMTKIQTNLYEFFLENRPNQDQKGKSLIPDYTVLRKIWTHPKVLENAYLNALQNKTKVKPPITTNANDSDDDQPDDVLDSQTGQMSVTSDWWKHHLNKEDLETILPSNKIKVVFEILNQCHRNKEKCLIFSAFVAVLGVVEFFMRLINDQEKDGNKPGLETYRGPFVFGQDYYRLDGKTAKNQRHNMITSFNDPKNDRTRVFLISAKAGGQGINLIGANRVILLDTSWNPSNDQQNIFRVFRLGQKRICYIYRLLSMGTMEEKVYSRSVTKQAMSCRVMDEQQIDRHYNMAELTELYILTTPVMSERPTPNVPRDDLLAHLLMKFPHMVYKYHEHDSLLENKGEEELSEQEKSDAWAAYEADVKRKNESNMGPYNNNFNMVPNYSGMGYANSLFNSYNNLSGVSGLNYPYNMYNPYGHNPYSSNYDQMRFIDYAQFYSNLMNVSGSSLSNFNQSNSNIMSPNHSSSVSSPPPVGYNSSRNWMQSNASSSNYNLLSSLAQTPSSSSKGSYTQYLNNLYNALGTNNPAPSANANATTSKSPPLPLSSSDFNALAYLQKQHSLAAINATNPSRTSPLAASNSQQGPNALRNPLLTKELTLPRNPTLGTPKEMFNLPIPTSVITKTTTSTTSAISSMMSSTAGSSHQNDTTTSKSPEISSSVDKATAKPKSATENQIIVKDVTTINNESRDSPDTTGNNQTNKSTDKASVSNGVSSTVKAIENAQKTALKSVPTATAISTNMGIVYPTKQASVASTSKTVTASVQPNAKGNDKDQPKVIPTTSSVVLNKNSAQPMPAIIRKPTQANAKGIDPTNDAVAAINKNKALTVTQRSVASPSKVLPVTGVNNSITLSAIPNSTKFGSTSVSITPQGIQSKTNSPTLNRTQSPLAKANTSSAVPVALSKVNVNQTTVNKSPTPTAKPSVLGSRNGNTFKTLVSVPKNTATTSPVAASTRIANFSSNVAPKIIVQRPSAQTFKPIIAQTKAQAASSLVNKPTSSGSVEINRVVVKPRQGVKPTILQGAKPIIQSVNVPGLELRKRTAAAPIIVNPPKRARPMAANSLLIPSSSPSGSTRQQNSLQGIRVTQRAQSASSKAAVPVEIVELD